MMKLTKNDENQIRHNDEQPPPIDCVMYATCHHRAQRPSAHAHIAHVMKGLYINSMFSEHGVINVRTYALIQFF